jgi:hypothetical protein
MRVARRAVAAGAVAYAIYVALSGGFTIAAGGVRLSSHRVSVPFVIGLLALFGSPEDRTAFLSWLNGIRGDRVPGLAAGLFAAAGLGTAFLFRAFVAAGADLFGYIAQSELWQRGELYMADGPAMAMRWTHAAEAFCPIGFRPALDRGAVAPVYAPGFPLMMSAASRLLGEVGPPLIVPLCAGATIYLTFLLGRKMYGPAVGVAASALVATSPVFLFQSVQPMSDVPVTACWLAAGYAISGMELMAPLGAGLWSSLAVLVRPNLSPLLAPLALLAIWNGTAGRRRTLLSLSLLAAGASIGVGLAAWEQATFYGSPFLSGYGRPAELFSLQFVWVNLVRYATWLWQTHTPILFLALLSPFVLARRGPHEKGYRFLVFALTFIAGVLCCYLPYYAFDHWTYLRFLLPAVPYLAILSAGVLRTLCARFGSSQRALVAVTVTFVALFQIQVAVRGDAFRLRDAFLDQYRDAGRIINTSYPPKSVFISVLQSGSVRYYGRRDSVRFDFLGADELDRAVADLTRAGFKPYLLLDATEEAGFRSRFGDTNRLGRLDWPPRVRLGRQGNVAIYDPSDAHIDD